MNPKKNTLEGTQYGQYFVIDEKNFSIRETLQGITYKLLILDYNERKEFRYLTTKSAFGKLCFVSDSWAGLCGQLAAAGLLTKKSQVQCFRILVWGWCKSQKRAFTWPVIAARKPITSPKLDYPVLLMAYLAGVFCKR